MNNVRELKDYQIILLGIFIAIGAIISTMILSGGIVKFKKLSTEAITITGSAQKTVRSDFAVWKAGFETRGTDLKAAYAKLQQDSKQVENFLKSRGFQDKDINFSGITTQTLYKKSPSGFDTNEIDGYRLSQNIQASSASIDKITAISRDSTALINEGVALNSYNPEYYYSQLESLKVKMLASAAENAKQRAKSMAESTGNEIGVLNSAKMGVFQITPVNSTDVSDWGINDTTSIEKKVTAVVSATFSLR